VRFRHVWPPHPPSHLHLYKSGPAALVLYGHRPCPAHCWPWGTMKPPALNMPEPEGDLALGHSFSEQSPASVACQPLSQMHVPSPLSHSPWPEQMSDCEEGRMKRAQTDEMSGKDEG